MPERRELTSLRRRRLKEAGGAIEHTMRMPSDWEEEEVRGKHSSDPFAIGQRLSDID